MACARVRLAIALLLAATAAGDAFACDSTGCLLVTRSASGLPARKSFRLDFSYRMTDDSVLLNAQASRRLRVGGLGLTERLLLPGQHHERPGL